MHIPPHYSPKFPAIQSPDHCQALSLAQEHQIYFHYYFQVLTFLLPVDHPLLS